MESADGCASCEYNAGKEHISLSEVHGHDHSANPERMSPLEKEPETARHVAMAQVGILCSPALPGKQFLQGNTEAVLMVSGKRSAWTC